MLGTLAKIYFGSFQPAIQDWKNNPLQKQSLLFEEIIRQSRKTLIDQTYNTSAIKTYQEFTKALPVVEYDEFKPFIDQALAYQPNVLIAGHVRWFAKSSGTTSDRSKFIPTSSTFFNRGHYLASRHMMSQYLASRPNSRLVSGKHIAMGGSNAISHTHPKITTGDLSALLLQNAPFLIRTFYMTPSLDIMIMEGWEKKLSALAKATIHQHITGISGVPTWTIAFIQLLLQMKNKSTLAEIWDDFELYVNGGVAYKPYVHTMQQLIGNSFNTLEVYNASEGFFAGQSSPDDEEGLLLYVDHGTFFEFMETEYPSTIVPLEGVELGKNYALIVSNLSGLYRYIVGDTIRFTSLRPYKIVVTGRLKQFINAVGEELMVHNTDEAIAKVANGMNIDVRDYSVGPSFPTTTQKAYHEWVIATQQQLNDKQKKDFIQKLDDCLCLSNSDYQAKRQDNLGLLPPVVHFVDETFFERWLKVKNKLGGQHKVPRLENSRKYLDEMLGMLSS